MLAVEPYARMNAVSLQGGSTEEKGKLDDHRRDNNVVSLCPGKCTCIPLDNYTFFHNFLLLLHRTDRITSQAKAVVPPTRY